MTMLIFYACRTDRYTNHPHIPYSYYYPLLIARYLPSMHPVLHYCPLLTALGTQSSMVAGQTPVSVTSSSGVKMTAQYTLSTDLKNAKLSPPQTQAEQAYGARSPTISVPGVCGCVCICVCEGVYVYVPVCVLACVCLYV